MSNQEDSLKDKYWYQNVVNQPSTHAITVNNSLPQTLGAYTQQQIPTMPTPLTQQDHDLLLGLVWACDNNMRISFKGKGVSPLDANVRTSIVEIHNPNNCLNSAVCIDGIILSDIKTALLVLFTMAGFNANQYASQPEIAKWYNPQSFKLTMAFEPLCDWLKWCYEYSQNTWFEFDDPFSHLPNCRQLTVNGNTSDKHLITLCSSLFYDLESTPTALCNILTSMEVELDLYEHHLAGTVNTNSILGNTNVVKQAAVTSVTAATTTMAQTVKQPTLTTEQTTILSQLSNWYRIKRSSKTVIKPNGDVSPLYVVVENGYNVSEEDFNCLCLYGMIDKCNDWWGISDKGVGYLKGNTHGSSSVAN